MRPTPKRLTTQAPQLDICRLPSHGVYRQGDTVVISWRGIVSSVVPNKPGRLMTGA